MHTRITEKKGSDTAVVELSVGCKVIIGALQSRPELNGTRGRCLGYFEDHGRWGVRCDNGEEIALKPESLTAVVEAAAAVHATAEETVPLELTCSTPPILANGFQGSVAALVKSHFEWTEPGGPCGTSDPVLSCEDESTITPGLFLCGPMVRHEGIVFCFIFKFRQRFGIVANAIAERLGLDRVKIEKTKERYR